MEQLKDPATFLSIINTIAVTGSTYYFYKQGETFQISIDKINTSMTSCTDKIKKLDNSCRTTEEGLKILNEKINKLEDKIKDLPTNDNIRDLDHDIEEIVDVMNDNKITVNRPSQRGYRSGDYRDRYDRDTRDNRREIREIENDRSFHQMQSNRRNDMSFRDRRSYRDNRDSRDFRDDRSELTPKVRDLGDSKEDEIDALIEGTRKQTVH